ncbi:MAG: amidase [Verrucomicrobiota bacterium]
MNRRTFFGTALTATLGAVVGAGSKSGELWAATRPVGRFEWEEWSIADLQTAMDAKRLTALALTRKYLERIEALDRHGPNLNSVIELNPEALAIARDLDRERKARGRRGPLHGIPILIKDNIATHDSMSTTAGSLALCGAAPRQDAFVVQRLREAGAVILGKTNLSEWANFRSSQSTSGWSGRGGLTRNPYVLDRNPSGSSSGSGAAVAANLCAASVGTETDGSILSPSSVNGIVGIKPTLGLVSRAGIIPIAHSQDTAGPMARSVTDAAALLGVLAGADPRNAITGASPEKRHTDYTGFLDPHGLKGARIGVARKLFDLHPGAAKPFEEAIEAMRGLGAVIIDPIDIPSTDKLGSAEMEVLLFEFKADLNAYLSGLGRGHGVQTLQDIIEFNEQNRDREMPYFGQDLMVRAQAKGPLTEGAYAEALQTCRRLSRREGIDLVMDRNQLDALVAPTAGPAHVTDLVYGDRDIGGSTQLAAVAGYPSITVPAGFVGELPVGLSFFGRAYSEPILLKVAFAFEVGTRVRRPPRFLPSSTG